MNINPDAAREFRNARGLTLRDVAEATGRSIGTLSDVENGRRTASDDLIRQLADVYVVPLNAICTDPEDRFASRLSALERKVEDLEDRIKLAIRDSRRNP